MYSRILVPLDGSSLAELVLPYARVLGKAFGAQVVLYGVFDPTFLETVADSQGREPLSVKRRETADYLISIQSRLVDEGLKATSTFHDDEPLPLIPADCILDEAEKEPSTLIAMSTHGRAGIGRWLLGSTTAKVFQATRSPMLVVRPDDDGSPPQEGRLGSVLVPLDGSPLAEQVLPHATAVAKALDLEVTLLRVTPGLRPAEMAAPPPEPREPDPEAVAYLEPIEQRLRKAGVAAVKTRAEYAGSAASAIIDVAQELPNCLIALTSHGRSGIGRWYIGSVADRVVRYARRAVLLTRAT